MSEGAPRTSIGGQLEERVDLSAETEAKLCQAQTLVNSSTANLSEALSLLVGIEKRCRVGNDTPSLIKVCEKSLQICKDCADEETLITTLKNLATRRSQKSKAVNALVQKAIPWVLKSEANKYMPLLDIETEEQKKTRGKLVVALRDITFGNIFLETERVKLTRVLAVMKESDGDIPGAADVLQEVHVETYGSLSKREKVDFILEQIRLTLGKKDYVRADILSNKINCKAIAEEGMEEEKIKFYTLMTEYHRHQKDALELARDYHQIYCTSSVQAIEEQWRDALQNTVLFLVLSPYSMEQQSMINCINVDPKLENIDACRELITLIAKKEIINYPIPYHREFESLNAFTNGEKDLSAHWKHTFHIRIIQHNIRVAALYYRRIHGKRLGQLVGMNPKDLEQEIGNMVSGGEIYAKIDRPNDIINFSQNKSSDAILSNWAADISSLLCLIETTAHLIQKENMTQ